MARHEYVRRICDEELAFQLECAGAVVVQGPKWCGKTRTSEEIAKSVIKLQDPLKKKEYHQIAQTMPSVLLEGRSPRLIDEWQDEPDLWNLVRATVDERGGAGHFIFAVNLNSLSLTLDQFNAAASGKYNIGRINQGRRNVNKLATSAELYGNASPETLASRAKTRDKVNAQTESNRKISKADKTVGSLLDIMQYEGGRTLGHTVAGQAKDGQCRRIPAGRTRRRPGARLAQRRSHQQGARCLLQQLEDRHQERIEVDTDALYANISDVLNGKKHVDSGNKADVNIINQIEDDLDENLNINAFRGEN